MVSSGTPFNSFRSGRLVLPFILSEINMKFRIRKKRSEKDFFLTVSGSDEVSVISPGTASSVCTLKSSHSSETKQKTSFPVLQWSRITHNGRGETFFWPHLLGEAHAALSDLLSPGDQGNLVTELARKTPRNAEPTIHQGLNYGEHIKHEE